VRPVAEMREPERLSRQGGCALRSSSAC
jgi:hypothetical protein